MDRSLSQAQSYRPRGRQGARQAVTVFGLSLLLLAVQGCDPKRKKNCEWQLRLNRDVKATADKGLISVCAYNFRTKDSICGLQTSLSFAKKVASKTFRFVDIKVKAFGHPRTIQEMAFCLPTPNKSKK